MVPEALISVVAGRIQELLDLDYIEPSNSEIASPIVRVLKCRNDKKCRGNWCCNDAWCISVVSTVYAICHRMPGSYNAYGILTGFSDSDLKM